MAVKEIKHRLDALWVVALKEILDAFVKLFGVQGCQFARGRTRAVVVIGKDLIAPEGKHRGAELVIHYRVPLATQQPGIGNAPFLTGDVTLGVDCFDRIPESFPVLIAGVVNRAGVHIGADVQPPAIG